MQSFSLLHQRGPVQQHDVQLNHMPKISVIIPSYNCERYIAETIESVLNQSEKSIELVVIDDGSHDGTREIVKSYGAPVRLIEQSNAGVCAARNLGIREAAGDYLCFLDHDDFWFSDKLARQLECFDSNPETGVVYSAFTNWHANSDGRFPVPSTLRRMPTEDDIAPDFSGWIYHQFLLDCWMLTSTAMFRAEIFRKVGGFDETLPYSEDWELWLRISREFPMTKLRYPTTLYRQHRQQGNRVLRQIDYRTRLLTHTAREHGLCSKDGRCISNRRFLDQLAVYHASFALGHLQGGNRRVAIRSFFEAWRCAPRTLKYLAYIPATMFGWRPKW